MHLPGLHRAICFLQVLDGNLSLAIRAHSLQLALLAHICGFLAQGRCHGVCEGHLVSSLIRCVAKRDALVTGSNSFRPCPHAHLC